MANRIKLIRLDGNDILSKSMKTINLNYGLIEDTINAQVANDISGLCVDEVNWRTGTNNGPGGTIRLSNGKVGSINPIPVAGTGQSGVITNGPQTIGGLKKFDNGIITDAIYDENGKYMVFSDGNKVYIGGENGIILEYDGNSLVGISYGVSSGTGNTSANLLDEINSLRNSINRGDSRMSNFESAVSSIRSDISEQLDSQARKLNTLSLQLSSYATSIADITNQSDGMVEHWFGEYDEMETLVSGWVSEGVSTKHTGDTFTVVKPVDGEHYKDCYRFTGAIWSLMSREDYPGVVEALINSLEALSVADGKCTTFYLKFPPVPCHIGDIWITSDAFYTDNGNQVFKPEGVDVSEWSESIPDADIFPEQTVLFCIRDNESGYGSMSDWSKDIKTWSQVQFEKVVESRFDETEEAVGSVKDAINAINDDNTFSSFEKNDFLNNTWYMIAGSYTYSPEQGSISGGRPSDDFLGTSTGGSFRDSISDYIGDNTIVQDTTPIDEIVSAFRNLGAFLAQNGLFSGSIVSSDWVTSKEHTEENLGRVAKQELSELLYHYYREEEECRKQAYVHAVTSMIGDIQNQPDNMIQNWYMENLPVIQDDMPWRMDGESVYEYTVNDRRHIDDTLVHLGNGRAVYKFSERVNQDDEIGQNDRGVRNTLFYWRQISRSDIDTIMEELNINAQTATADGSVNVFNTLPRNYSYGDIWFCRGEGQEDGYENLSESDKNRFKAGCIYYCSRETFPDGSDEDELLDRVRRNFVGNDWSNGYEQGEEFITSFSEMMSDDHLTPVEKSQIFREWYEIAGFDLIGGDGVDTDSIVGDVFDDDGSNTGSFRYVMNNASKLLRDGAVISDSSDFESFINSSGEGNGVTLMQTLRGLRDKFVTLHTALIQCGVNDMSSTTDLGSIVFSGINGYNGHWNRATHMTMLPDLFTQYYLEEDNVKSITQNIGVQEQLDEISADFVDFTNTVDNLLSSLGDQTDGSIQNWFGTVVPERQENLPWRNELETDSEYDTNDYKHRDDVFIKSIGGITEVYRFSTGSIGTDGIAVENSPLHWEKISSADIQTIHQYLGIDTELAGADGSITVFDSVPHDYTYGDIWFCGDEYTSDGITFKAGCIYWCSNDRLTTEPQHDFVASDWTEGYTYANDVIEGFRHLADDGWLTQIEKDQLLSKWHEIAGVDIFGNDGVLPGATLSDIFSNNPNSGGSFRSAVNNCTQFYDEIDSVDSYSGYNSLKTRITADYPELGTLIGNLENRLTEIRTILVSCNCHEQGDQDLSVLTFEFSDAPLSMYNGDWTDNKNGSMFSEVFTRYYLAESNVRDKAQEIRNENMETAIGNFETRVVTAETASQEARQAMYDINDDNVFSVFEKNSFLTNTFIPISGSGEYEPGSDVSYVTINGISCPATRPTQIGDFLGTTSNGSFIRTIDSVWPSGVSDVSDNVKIRVGELVAAYKNLARLCKSNGLFDTPVVSSSFCNSSGTPVSGSEGKNLLSNALYNYNREENECNKLLYIDAVSDMIASLTDQIDGQIKRYYRNDTPPSTTDGCSNLFGCPESDFGSHVSDEYVHTNQNNDVYIFTYNGDYSEISSPDIEVSGTSYYWKKVSNSSLATLISTLEGYMDDIAISDGFINIYNTLPPGEPVTPYSYGDIWFCTQDYHDNISNKDFETGHIYYCCNKNLRGNSTGSTFDGNDWTSGYSYGDDLLVELSAITSDSCVSIPEKSSLIQTWCEISGYNTFLNTTFSQLLESILNSTTNTGSFRSVIDDCYSCLNSGSHITQYSQYSGQNWGEFSTVVTDIVEKFNDIFVALKYCGCTSPDTKTDLTSVTFSGFQYSYSYNGVFGESHKSMLPTVFATYYFEETNLRTLVQNKKAEVVANEVVDTRMESIMDTISELVGSEMNMIANDGVFTVDEKTRFLHNTWQTIAGSIEYRPSYDGSAYLQNGKLKPDSSYLGTSDAGNGSFRTLLNSVGGFTINGSTIGHDGQVGVLIQKFKNLGAECDAHGLFPTPPQSLQSSEFTAQHDIDDLYDKLYEYYNAEEVLRQNLQENAISEAVSALYGQEDGTIAIYSKDTLPPSTGQGLLNLWFNGSVPSGVTVGTVVGNHIGDEYRYTSPSNPKNYVFSTGTAGTDDIAISDVNGYMWKVSSESSLSELITQVQQLADGYSVDGVVNIFGPEKLPTSYDYGDIWFFGGVEAISPALNSQEIHNYGLDGEKWVAGNVYYCCTGDSDSEPFTGFDADNWECGVQGSILAQMTDDDWLSVNEKQILLSKWYDITGVDFYSFTNNSNYQTPGSLITALENSPNANINGSFQTISDQYGYVTGLDSNGGSSEPGGGGNQGGTPAEETISEEEQAEQETIHNMLNEINIDGGVVGKDCLVFEIREGLEENGYYLGVVSEDGFSYNILRGFSQRNYPGVYTVNDGSINTGMYLGESFSIDIDETYISNVNILQVRFIEKDREPDDFIEIENIGRIGSDVGNDAISITIRNDSNEITIHSENGINLYGYSFEKIPFDQIDIDNMSDDDNRITVHDAGDVGEECPHTLYVYISINSASTDIQAVEDCMTQLQSDLWNIYTILYRCECGDTTNGKYLGGVSVSGLQSPFNGKTGYITNNRTIISDIFNQYYSDEQNLRVEMTEFEIQTTDPMEGLAEDNGEGLLLTSYIKLKYDGVVTGGLNGITAENNNVGLWFGGSYNAAKNGTVPLNITKTGYGSKIGPLTVGGSSLANEHIFIGNENSGDVTVIGKDYISLGAGYSNSNTSGKAERNSVIYLNSGGYGSKIGPLTVGRNGITFGANLPVYRFKHSNAGDFSCELQPSTSSYNIDGYTNFTQNDLNLTATNGMWCSPTGVSVSVTVDITNGTIK